MPPNQPSGLHVSGVHKPTPNEAVGCATIGPFAATVMVVEEAPPPSCSGLYSAFHVVTAIVGAGVLGLPYCFAVLGWAGGLVTLIGALALALYTFALLVHMHEYGPDGRFERYHELCDHAWGKPWVLLVFQLPYMYGTCITYTVTGGVALRSAVALIASQGSSGSSSGGGSSGGSGGGSGSSADFMPLAGWIGIFSFVEILLCQLPSLDSLTWISGVGAAMSFFYCMGGSALALKTAAPRSKVDFTVGAGGDAKAGPPLQQVMATFSAITTIFFAYSGHNIAHEIQATLPFPPSTVAPMMRGVFGAFAVTLVCYTLTACSGYYAYGSEVKDNILNSVGPSPLWLLVACNMAVVLHVLASYQVFGCPMLCLIDCELERLLSPACCNKPRSPERGGVPSSESGAAPPHPPHLPAKGGLVSCGSDAEAGGLLPPVGSAAPAGGREQAASFQSTGGVAGSIGVSSEACSSNCNNSRVGSSGGSSAALRVSSGGCSSGCSNGGGVTGREPGTSEAVAAKQQERRQQQRQQQQQQQRQPGTPAAAASALGWDSGGSGSPAPPAAAPAAAAAEGVFGPGSAAARLAGLLLSRPRLRRFAVALPYVASTCFLAALIPFFGDLMGLFGALGAMPTNFVLPCLLWLALRRPRRWVSIDWWLCWVIVVGGSVLGVLGAAGALYGIVRASSSYKIFA